MLHKKTKAIAAGILLSVGLSSTALAANVWEVNSNGNITLNGSVFRMKGGSWFGLEGRHELASDPQNPSGAPMEMYMGNVFWAPTNRTLATDAAEIKSLGFNCIRLPLSPQTLSDSDPQGKNPVLKNTESVRIQGAFSALKAVIRACSDAGLYVLLDLHSCSNYVGWRAGRLDARPPYADATREEYDFKREDCSCAETGNPSSVTRIHAYNVSKWLDDLKVLAGLGAQMGVDNIMGIDIFNEPWDYSWSEWKSLIDQAYTAVSSVNPNVLIFAQGIGSTNSNQDGTPQTIHTTPHGNVASNPNWGENLFEVRDNPPVMPKRKLVFSPHTYGPSVHTQSMFADVVAQPECAGLEGTDFGDAKCQVVIDPVKLEQGWQEHFGYLKSLGYAVCIGEYGGNMDWPNKSEIRHQNRYSYLTDKTTDEKWQNAFVDYLIKQKIYDSFYWSINPESADTYGIFGSPYDPISNKTGWGTWSGTDSRKLALLGRLWNASDNDATPVVPAKQAIHRTEFSCHTSKTGVISYSLPKAEVVTLQLHTVNGKLQSEMIDQQQKAGSYSLNLRQLSIPAGSYMLVLKAGGYRYRNMVLLTK